MLNRKLRVWKYVQIVAFVICCMPISGADQSNQKKFLHKMICDGLINNEAEISLRQDDQLIGFAHYTKIPLVASYVIHTLYVYPQYRNKGCGSELLIYVCNYLKNQEAKKIYIQPGAFELGYKDPYEIREVKTKRLVEFYKKFGFKFVDPAISRLAVVLYKLLRIDENSQYLMIKDLQH